LIFYPSQGAVLIGMVYEFLPFMILPIFTSLEKIEPNLYEAAADLGANAFRTFLRVTLPLSMPGVVAGTILTFVPVIGTFVVSDILGGRQVILVGNLVQRQFLDARNPPFGSAASVILLLMTLALTLYYTRRFGLGEEIVSSRMNSPESAVRVRSRMSNTKRSPWLTLTALLVYLYFYTRRLSCWSSFRSTPRAPILSSRESSTRGRAGRSTGTASCFATAT
jgi:ABC-type Fe3+ transport system permease subunit